MADQGDKNDDVVSDMEDFELKLEEEDASIFGSSIPL